jgi:small-conductance mechanosensitive channel
MRLFTRGLMLALLLLTAHVFAADYQANIDRFQQRLDQLSPDDTSPDIKQQRERLQKIVAAYQEAKTYDAQAANLREQIEKSGQVENQLRRQLNEKSTKVHANAFDNLSASQLEQQLTLTKANQLELIQNRERLQNQIAQSDQRLIDLRNQLTNLKQNSINAQDSTSDLAQAEFARKTARTQAIELEILFQPEQTDQDRLRLEQLNQQLEAINQKIGVMQNTVQDKRKKEAQAALEALSENSGSNQRSPVLKQLINETQSLSDRLETIQSKTLNAQDQRQRLESELTIVTQSYNTIQQQLELSSQPLGVELRNFTKRLSQPISTGETKDAINDLRLSNLEISRELFQMERGEQLPDLAEGLAEQARQLLSSKETLLTQIRDASNEAINELSQLLTIQEQINTQIRLGRDLISQHMLWIPSIQPVSSNWPVQILNGMGALYDNIKPYDNIPIHKPVSQWIPPFALWLLICLAAILVRRAYRVKAPLWASQIGHVKQDRFIHTFNLLWMPLIYTLPAPTFVILIGRFILNAEAWPTDALTLLTKVISVGIWIYMVVQAWMKTPNAVLHGHFGMPEKLCVRTRRLLHPLFWLGMPLIIILLITDQSSSSELQSGIGRLTFIILASLVTLFWLALMSSSALIDKMTSGEHWWQKARVWIWALVAIHIVAIGIALLGYVFTGTIVMLILLVMAGIVASTFILFKLGNRWLLIEERHLAFERAKQRRNEILEAREKNEEIPPLEENFIDVQTLSDQARILLKTVTIIAFASLLWMLVKSVLPTLDVLDQIVLWGGSVDAEGSIVSQAITLKNLLFSLVLISLCVLAAYNLPGLLELLVLRHITLAPGTSYAITSVTKYALIVISVLVGASQLGLEWSKLQWLIAALGVGLGFGLQEIVANFISGIIILFEKPIRIGDTITIGGVSGNVSRIQIRATTITDWDRKEVIIPNKTFVTDQLINWSLTDPITRVVITVGVAYGSDTKKAHEILLNVAKNHPRVLEDPAPQCFFTVFGASTLDFELRFFVNSLADRLEVSHELNQQIDESFKQNGIEIAFPQLDVHLHRSPKKKGE